jgi:hypothetical protein
MKKFIFFLAVAMMAATSVKAQSDSRESKHEIAASYGSLSNSDWLNIFENVIGAIFGETYKDDTFFGPIGLEYFYHFKPWLGVGVITTYGQLVQDGYKGDDKVGKKSNYYFTALPAVKFDWLRRDVIGLYSKLGAGVTMRRETREFYGENAKHDTDKTDFHFNWQVSIIGVEVGKRLRGFAEGGFGEQGVLLAGLRYRF